MKRIFILTMFFAASLQLFSQTEPYTSLFPMQTRFYNPAFVGQQEKSTFQLSGRTQWVGIDKNPKSAIFNYDHFFSKLKGAVGVSYAYDKYGFTTNNKVGLIYSQRIQVNDDLNFRLGGEFAYRYSDYDFELGESRQFVIIDPVFVNYEPDGIFDFSIGLNMQYKNFTTGFSTLHLFEPAFEYAEGQESPVQRAYYFMVMYDWKVSENLTITPASMYRAQGGANLLDFYLTSLFFKHYILGTSVATWTFDQNNHLNFMGGYEFKEDIRIMLSTGLSNSLLNNTSGMSYELAINCSF